MQRPPLMHKDYYRDRWRARRIKAIETLGGKCITCGATDDLEFDHIDPKTKKKRLAKLLTYAWETVEKELEKCQLLCIPCHRKKSKQEAGTPDHGTVWMAKKCGPPRCRVCKETLVNNKNRMALRWLLRNQMVTLTAVGLEFLNKSTGQALGCEDDAGTSGSL